MDALTASTDEQLEQPGGRVQRPVLRLADVHDRARRDELHRDRARREHDAPLRRRPEGSSRQRRHEHEGRLDLFKTEVIRRRGPWRKIDDVEFATLEWIDWFNRRRLFGSLGYVPPVEFEESYYRAHETPAAVAGLM